MIETLDNEQQILLLYLADELPPEDRAEVQRRLTTDESLAAELDRLGSMRLEIEEGLARLDKNSGIGLRAETSARQIGREIRQYLARPKVAAPTPFAKPHRRLTPWLVPAGIAAAVVVGVLVSVTHRAMPQSQRLALTQPSHDPSITIVAMEPARDLDLFEQSFESLDDASRSLARADARKDMLAQDEISRQLLSLDAAQ